MIARDVLRRRGASPSASADSSVPRARGPPRSSSASAGRDAGVEEDAVFGLVRRPARRPRLPKIERLVEAALFAAGAPRRRWRLRARSSLCSRSASSIARPQPPRPRRGGRGRRAAGRDARARRLPAMRRLRLRLHSIAARTTRSRHAARRSCRALRATFEQIRARTVVEDPACPQCSVVLSRRLPVGTERRRSSGGGRRVPENRRRILRTLGVIREPCVVDRPIRSTLQPGQDALVEPRPLAGESPSTTVRPAISCRNATPDCVATRTPAPRQRSVASTDAPSADSISQPSRWGRAMAAASRTRAASRSRMLVRARTASRTVAGIASPVLSRTSQT